MAPCCRPYLLSVTGRLICWPTLWVTDRIDLCKPVAVYLFFSFWFIVQAGLMLRGCRQPDTDRWKRRSEVSHLSKPIQDRLGVWERGCDQHQLPGPIILWAPTDSLQAKVFVDISWPLRTCLNQYQLPQTLPLLPCRLSFLPAPSHTQKDFKGGWRACVIHFLLCYF